MMDFTRYASDSVTEHINWQAELIRKNCPDTEITTNVWFCTNMPNFYNEFAKLDFISYDNYPTTRIPDNSEEYYSHAFHLDLMRGVKRKNFWIMEQLSGGLGCWAPMGRTPSPGMIKGYALQAFAHGADTVVQFRWRTAVSGAEMHWHGLIDHSNVSGRRFNEFADLYKSEAQAISDSMTTALTDLATAAYSYGACAAQQFSAGFTEAANELSLGALYNQIQAAGATRTYENYITNIQGGGKQELVISVDVTGKSNVYLDRKLVGDSITEYQGQVKRTTGG